MKRIFFIFSFLAILTFSSSVAAFASTIVDDAASVAPIVAPDVHEPAPLKPEEASDLDLITFGKTEFNKWADSKEYKLALAEYSLCEGFFTINFDKKHLENAIKHLEKELKQHPQNAYADYYLAECKAMSSICNENEAESKVLANESLKHFKNCIDKLPSGDVDSKIEALLERASLSFFSVFDYKEKATKDIMQAFDLRPTYDNLKFITNSGALLFNKELMQELASRLLKTDPNNVDLNLMLGDSYIYEDPEKALEYYNAACAQHNNAKALISRAQLLANNDDYSNALNDVIEANKIDISAEEESVDLLCQIAKINEMWFNRVAKICDNGTLSNYKNYILGNGLIYLPNYGEKKINDYYQAITYLTKSIEEDKVYNGIQNLSNCYVATGNINDAIDVLFNNFDKLNSWERSKLFELETEHKLYDRCVADAKTLNFAGQISDDEMLKFAGHALFLKHDYNAVVETFNKYITSVRDYNDEVIPLSAFFKDSNIDFFYYACSLIITGKEKEGRELMSLMSDSEQLYTLQSHSKKILALHFAGRDAEAIASHEKMIEDNNNSMKELIENYEPSVNYNDVCLYTILGQTEKAKHLIASDKEIMVARYAKSISKDESILGDDAINEKIDDLILELSDTPLIDLTEFKQLIQSN